MEKINFPELQEGDYVRMYCNWCEQDLWLQYLGPNQDGESPGFSYFHPVIGHPAAWYISHITSVMRNGEVIW